MDVVVKGRCYIDGRLSERCIGIVDGRISAISGDLDGERVYNYGNKLILPSAIDAHVHMRDPGATHKEDFSAEFRKALEATAPRVFLRGDAETRYGLVMRVIARIKMLGVEDLGLIAEPKEEN